MVAPLETDVSQDKLRYRVFLLGPLILERGGERIEAGRWQHRVRTLFLLLMTSPDRQRRREELMDVLWPDADPESAAGNLRILVHRLRLTLGGDPSPVLSDHGWIRLNPIYAWESDLDAMDDLVRQAQGDVGRLQSAAALYRGEPLIEHRYEDWAISVSERAQRMWRAACLQLASIFRIHGQYDEASAGYLRLLDADPLDEEAMQGLLLTLGDAGKSSEAVRQYERFKDRMISELDVPPSPEVASLADRLKRHSEDAPAIAAPLPFSRFPEPRPAGPLIGRHDELERALLVAGTVEAGSGRAVLVAGEEGVGKTRFIQEVMIGLEERGFNLATTRCLEREGAVPFAPFLDLLTLVYAAVPLSVRLDAIRHWPELAWLLPEGVVAEPPAAPEEPDEQRALFRAAGGFLSLAARDRPLALLLEDLQWADEGSLDLFRYVTQQTRGSSVLVIGAYCETDISLEHPLRTTIRDLTRDGIAERISLSRFDPEETAQLVTAKMNGLQPPAEFVEFVYRRTKGNPFYISRMVEALGGRYRLVRQIAAGGMGRVFEAIDIETDERVAAKLMFARTEADPRALLRFRQEGVALASLHHPNIVRVRATIVEEHASCIVMDLIEGRTLADVLGDGPPSLQYIKKLTLQIASALTAAHERSIVHRDIKPSNIVVGDDDHVTVTDFGIARLIRSGQQATTAVSMTSTGMTLGTPLYMAPEQIQAAAVDRRADIYSFGAVLYHLVTGRPPFEADDPVSIAYQHVHEPPLPPRALRGNLPEEWESVILRALAKNPVDRFQTARAMEVALAGLPVPALMEEQPISSATGTPALDAVGTPAAPARSRHRVLLGAIGALAVAAITVLALVTHNIGSGGSTSNGPGQFNGPTGLATDDKGNVYAVDERNNRVQELSSTGAFLRQWHTLDRGSLPLQEPGDIARAPSTGDLFVSDLGHKRIVRIRGNRLIDSITFDAGSLALDSSGDLYASSYGNGIIGRFPSGSHGLTVIPIPQVAVGDLKWPAGIAVDRQGRLYIADRVNNRITRLSPTGKPLPPLGHFGTKPGELNNPTDIAIAGNGDIYVADTGNNRIQVLSQNGAFVRSWNGSGIGGLDHPVSVAVDWKYDVYVSDYTHNRVVALTQMLEPLWYSNGMQAVTVQ